MGAEVALEIGTQLASEAIWHEGRCNWIGPHPETGGGRATVAVRSLAPDLYAGTAGVGLVLAEVAAVTGDAACRRTALGALRQALSRVDRIEPQVALGLFSGVPGVALAAVRSGLLLDEAELVDGGRVQLGLLRSARTRSAACDLVGGRAGAVLALLALDAALSDPRQVALATTLGGELVAIAEERGSWHWPRQAAGSGLLAAGLSHGASGAAASLLELWAATGDPRFRAAADHAWASEDTVFDPLAGNWPAHPYTREDGRPGSVWASQIAWCHGAPGIGLARHRAWLATDDVARKEQVAVALETTAAWIRSALRSHRGSFSLCHGLAGNAEVLDECADAAGAAADDLRALVLAVARAGVEEYSRSSRSWPCGWAGGESPGLMIGLAGIARFYLRREMPALPSLMLIRPTDDWAGEVLRAAPPGRPLR